MAALRNGVRTVIIPRNNVRDLDEIDQTVRSALRFVPVKTVDEVLSEALVPQTAKLPVLRKEMPETAAAFAPIPAAQSGGDAVLRQ